MTYAVRWLLISTRLFWEARLEFRRLKVPWSSKSRLKRRVIVFFACGGIQKYIQTRVRAPCYQDKKYIQIRNLENLPAACDNDWRWNIGRISTL